MITEEEYQYIINLIVQQNKQILDKLENGSNSDDEGTALEKELVLSDSIFQKIITQCGVKRSKQSARQGKRILIVDDVASMRSLLHALLHSFGYNEIDSAQNGKEAWDILERSGHQYRIIISDWDMPEMSGIELLNKVREQEDLKTLPFLIVSANNKLEKIQQAIKAGVTDYLVKPLTEQVLADKIKKYIG